MHGRHALRAAPALPPCPFPVPPMRIGNRSQRAMSGTVLCAPVAGGDPNGMEGQGRSSDPPPVCPTSLTHAKHAGGDLGVAAVPRPVPACLLHGTARHGILLLLPSLPLQSPMPFAEQRFRKGIQAAMPSWPILLAAPTSGPNEVPSPGTPHPPLRSAALSSWWL